MMNRVTGRKNGVTIDQEFYKVLESEAFLTSSHLLFFQNLFFKYFQHQKKIFVADCYFFWQYMPNLSKQIPDDLVDLKKVEEMKKKMDIENVYGEEKNKTFQPKPILKGGSEFTKDQNNTEKQDSQISQPKIKSFIKGSFQVNKSSIDASKYLNQTQNLQTSEIVQSNISQQQYPVNSSEVKKPQSISQSQQMETQKINESGTQSEIYQQKQYPKSYLTSTVQMNKKDSNLKTGQTIQENQTSNTTNFLNNDQTKKQQYNEKGETKFQSAVGIVDQQQIKKPLYTYYPQSVIINSKKSEYNPSLTQSDLKQTDFQQKNNFNESGSKIGEAKEKLQQQEVQYVFSQQYIESKIISNNQKQDLQQQEQQQQEKIQEKQQQEQKPQMLFQIVSINVEQKEKEVHAVSKLEELFKTQTLNKESNFTSNPIYNYEYAYFPINLGNYHWISVIVNVKERKIIYADSLNGYSEEIVTGVKKILNFKNTPQIDNWDILRSTPQQSNGYDCGVFTLYNLYYIYQFGSEINKYSYSQQEISVFRRRLSRLTEEELKKEQLNAHEINKILQQLQY